MEVESLIYHPFEPIRDREILDSISVIVEEQKQLNFYKTLRLNADFTPVSYHPLSIDDHRWAIKQICKETSDLVACHPDAVLRTYTAIYPIPSVIKLREYLPLAKRVPFTKYNVYLRDMFTCQYCGERFDTHKLTFDHVIPRSRGGRTSWTNIVTACGTCNPLKDNRTPAEARMFPKHEPYEPTSAELQNKGRYFPPHHLHSTWRDYLYWSTELED